ncbi:hypothetical protein VB774_02095 [Pseudanabaena galeata UHCC 0370]|jgi:hypothetical protein|uniref:Contractile injection system tube protein N-terminal domain-containing protein n=1 Tax=Pseudanabaena galeata UHCC 0370 TaxID=3110310 RepID=A0ABU5TDW0_9CYAN|nr:MULTISPECIES: hypothetical protein [Pseudanabaena]MEA5476400.1 hypothetical protein [Pseudanabaena galeata UHCC 0370]MEA5487737.1 hypothetical protein [Pseudanabaena sp. CCNP1317]WGS72524.1 hypothetical protein OA858_00435 [Pseudanabaena galeata CCNP1313]
MTLVKAMLTTTDAGAVAINFQFNPESLSFARTVTWKVEDGAYTAAGFPKVSYSNRGAETLKLSNLWFDTYEYPTKTSVLDLISPIIKSTEIAGSLKRPPVYIFAWGEQYLKCVVTSISYDLTMFLADGTPVRAKVSIDLQEVDDI